MSARPTRLCLILGVVLATALAAAPGLAQGAERGEQQRGERSGNRISDADTLEVLQIITDLNPQLGAELETMRDEDPRQFARQINDRFPRYRWLLRLRRFDTPMYELRVQDIRLMRQTRELAGKVREAEEAGKRPAIIAARADLDAAVAAHFDVRQQIRQAELERLETRLDELQAQLAERKANRNRLIAEQVESLLAHKSDDASPDDDADDESPRHGRPSPKAD